MPGLFSKKSTGKPISGESKTFLRAVKRGAYSQLNFLFFILYFYIIASLIFIFSIIRTVLSSPNESG